MRRSRPFPKPFLLLAFTALLACSCHKGEKDFKKSVVKVFSTVQNVDYYEPWKPGSEARLEGCGSILKDGRILTTAHLIHKSTYIEVQKFGETKRYVAKVDADGYDTDLALLTVDDKDFFKGVKPVEFGDLPQPGDKLVLQGSDELSMKDDSVSGLDMVWTWEGGCFLPAIMTDSDIDTKNDGCPVLKDGKLVGIPFESWHQSKKAGSLMPVNMIEMFLKSVEGGRPYGGLSDLGVYGQDLENTALRDYYHLKPGQTGVVVTKVLYEGAAEGLLKEGDILMAIDGQKLDNEGYIDLGKSGRIEGDYLISLHPPGEETSLDILRDGKEMKIKVPLKPAPNLVSYRADNRHPTYFMIAGFVFVPLTYNFLQAAGSSNKPALQELNSHGLISPEHKEIVVMSHVLPHDNNVGYENMSNFMVDKVNGQPVTEMKDVISALNHPVGGYDIIEGDNHAWSGSVIVLNAKKAAQATQEILKTYRIPSDRSKDLK